jgi:hypothetical protein
MYHKIKITQNKCISQYKINIQKKENVHSFNQLFTVLFKIGKCIISINLIFYNLFLKVFCHDTMKRVTVIIKKLMGTELPGKGTEHPSLITKLPDTGTRLLYQITRLLYNGMEFRDTGMNISFCITGPFLSFTDLSPPVGIVSKQGTKLPYLETGLLYRGTKLLFPV